MKNRADIFEIGTTEFQISRLKLPDLILMFLTVSLALTTGMICGRLLFG